MEWNGMEWGKYYFILSSWLDPLDAGEERLCPGADPESQDQP